MRTTRSAKHKTWLVVLASAALGLLVVAGGLAQPPAHAADLPAARCTPGEPTYCLESAIATATPVFRPRANLPAVFAPLAMRALAPRQPFNGTRSR